eukprot:2206696-Amphidinium_carterae.1
MCPGSEDPFNNPPHFKAHMFSLRQGPLSWHTPLASTSLRLVRTKEPAQQHAVICMWQHELPIDVGLEVCIFQGLGAACTC